MNFPVDCDQKPCCFSGLTSHPPTGQRHWFVPTSFGVNKIFFKLTLSVTFQCSAHHIRFSFFVDFPQRLWYIQIISSPPFVFRIIVPKSSWFLLILFEILLQKRPVFRNKIFLNLTFLPLQQNIEGFLFLFVDRNDISFHIMHTHQTYSVFKEASEAAFRAFKFKLFFDALGDINSKTKISE